MTIDRARLNQLVLGCNILKLRMEKINCATTQQKPNRKSVRTFCEK